MSEISELVRRSPAAVSIAILASEHQHGEDVLLTLGSCGIRRIVNLCDREGWNRLRSLVEETGGEAGTAILASILAALSDENESVAHFFGELVRLAPRTSSVSALTDRLGRHPSTFTSRFLRAGLPSPKMYLAMTRLAYAAAFLEVPRVSVADTAARLALLVPAKFRTARPKHARTHGGRISEYSFKKALEHFMHRLVFPYLDALRVFAPLGLGMIDRPRHVVRAELSAEST